MQKAPEEPKLPKTKQEKDKGGRLIVILENASLETVKVGNNYELLEGDEHKSFMKKRKREDQEARPDIVHQCLLTLLDSPLNKAGKLQVYIHTSTNVLIEVNPRTRIPRTYKRFAPLMIQLLHKLSIRATQGPERLLQVIKNPITDHLPTGAPKLGAEYDAPTCQPLYEIVKTLPDDLPVVFVVGAMAHGSVEVDYVERNVSFSEYPLSASVACGKICDAFEMKYGVL
ncbi:EMG1 nucleolar protein, putative [Acanthamoeba castellanii str. Neff]|uniref:EMG1 nucleolar protein, putative n=1 Tax=Acanthamoeba castellanii (strain ATCC 30010 / Neff) TaxID=1257118 RepID=L8HHN9_ACACF|nr:EMG1 nucleolar protein, putative [Acanthamoeba castellanii str. Neff]ELR24690.1 EMG1 nucleolar protein, putative [Acanthamoeba castellanii str. Neff]